ncbi:protein transporter SEC24 [Coprinopsis marcescibilis]|uniref:Protein transporter SEC24 n=1 Tax=Coprinopsis marcescibilis TaxID=230819 RepID=A0A5C3KI13_COPMA|nr:protein transporter SEC24 [Coprinopsis marcescibilis]
MYAHPNHIPQPPHSAGLGYKGLRPRIDPAQVPSPIDSFERDRITWEDKIFLTLPGSHAPLCTSNYVAVDQGNASPKFVRVSTWNMPSTSKLASDCKIPIAAIFQPLTELDPREEPVPVVDTGPSGPLRCQKCRGYVNTWCTWVAGGNRWKCNLCRHENDVPPEYFCNLDANNLRLDYLQRPELHKGTVDFVVPEEYWAQYPPSGLTFPYVSSDPPPTGSRPPVQMDYVFTFDVTNQAIDTGFLQAICESLTNALFGYTLEDGTSVEPSIPPNTRIAIITFDETIHFYDLSSELTPMLVVADLDEMYAPISTGLFASTVEHGNNIRLLLANLPARFAQTPSRNTALASAIRGSLAAFSRRGGHTLLFTSTLPTLGPGALSPTPPNEQEILDTEKEVTLHKPRDKLWLDLAEECVDEGVGVTLFLAPNSYLDIGSLGAVANYSGGEIFFHPRFESARDRVPLESQLLRVFRRTQVFNCTLRVRASTGLRIIKHYGNFLKRNTTDLEFGVLDADKTITTEIAHTGTLDPRGQAHLQCTALYTTKEGQRRARVINLALNVVELAANVFQYADMETTIAFFTREALSKVPEQRIVITRDELTEKCSSLLLGYRNQCAAATRNSQLIIPEAYRALPAFILALQKSKPLKGRHVSSDVRNYELHKMNAMDSRALIHHLYPRLMALHDLDDAIALPQEEVREDGSKAEVVRYPSCMRDSHYFMEAGGVYLIDNEELIMFWVGSSVSPSILQDLFGLDDFNQISPHTYHLPHINSTLSQQVRNILADRYAQRGRLPKMMIARQNQDGTEIEFSDMLVEDQNNGAMSYIDYLAVLHKQITNVLNNGGSFGPAAMRGSPW